MNRAPPLFLYGQQCVPPSFVFQHSLSCGYLWISRSQRHGRKAWLAGNLGSYSSETFEALVWGTSGPQPNMMSICTSELLSFPPSQFSPLKIDLFKDKWEVSMPQSKLPASTITWWYQEKKIGPKWLQDHV